jgi:hypothetical protein
MITVARRRKGPHTRRRAQPCEATMANAHTVRDRLAETSKGPLA